MDTDVIIVGGGLSGLYAARRLASAGVGVRVLEARDRVGGRTLSTDLGTDRVDLGAQWLGPTQDRAYALAAELGLATFPQWHRGRKILAIDGEIRTYRGLIPRVRFLHALEAGMRLWQLGRWARAVPLDAPWRARRAAAWDAEHAGAWFDRVIRTADARRLIEVGTRAIFCAEPEDLSFLYFLAYCRAGGSFDALARIRRGAQQDRLHGGMQGLSLGLAAELGEDVALSSPVEALEADDAGVTVHAAGRTLRGARVILALAPSLIERLRVSPALPAARRRLNAEMPMGRVIKFVARYPRPFWRERGLSGEVVACDGPVSAVMDDSAPDASQGALVGFVLGRCADAWRGHPEEAVRAAIVGALARFFGPDAGAPDEVVLKDWTDDPWSGGCYVGIMPPGLMTAAGAALRAPAGRLHFAGTETAVRWTGYMEGALEAGERAADECLAALGTASA